MAEVYRQSYTRTDPKTGEKVTKKAKKWYVRYYRPDGKRVSVPGYRDKKATEVLAAKLEKQSARMAEGLFDPTDEHAKTLLTVHAEQYRRYLADKGNTPAHVAKTFSRLQSCLNACQF